MSKELESRWKGIINKSTLEIAKRIIYLDSQVRILKKRASIAGLVLITTAFLFILYNGVNFLNWFATSLAIYHMVGVIILIIIHKKIQADSKDAVVNFKELKDRLIKRIDVNFCNCGQPCEHKEKFMDFMENTYKINLYY